MADPFVETVTPPFSVFRFEVVLDLDDPPGGVVNPVCNAAFAECDGLELSMESRTVQAGGENDRQHHLVAPLRHGQLILRRGMTSDLALWAWMSSATPGRPSTAQGEVRVLDRAGEHAVSFLLEGCLPVRLRGPSLNARDGQVAIEELQLAYGRLVAAPPGGLGFGLSIGFSAGVSVGASAGVSAGAGLSVSGGAGLGVTGRAGGPVGIGFG